MAITAPEEQHQDGLENALQKGSSGRVVDFLTRQPEAEIYATDTLCAWLTGDLYRVVLGQNNTLQVCVGRDRLAVVSHEDRFLLTPKSVNLIRDATRERLLKGAAPFEAAEYVGEYIDEHVEEPAGEETVDETPGQKLIRALETLLKSAKRVETDLYGQFVLITNPNSGPEFNRLRALAGAAGFAEFNFRHTNQGCNMPGFKGRTMATVLQDALRNGPNPEFVTLLRVSDRAGIGAWAISFFYGKPTIAFIFNKAKADKLEVK